MALLTKFFIFLLLCFFYNSSIFADVKDDISKINDLKESGLLSDQDYNNLLEKSIIQTEDYIKIRSLFDSEIINLEEFENFKEKIISKYSTGDSQTQDLSINSETKDKAAKEVADKTAKEAADKTAKGAADKAAKEAADKASDSAENNNKEIVRKEIGKVLKVKKGKGFGDDVKLRKKAIVETGVIYKTLAGGNLHLMLDEKTKIFIGYESEIIITKFDIVDKKVHEVEIELISGSFMYSSLRKTSTQLKVLIDDNILISKGYETSVAFVQNKKEIRFVNAGKSALSYEDKLLGFAQYAVLDPLSKSIAINSIANASGDKLVGVALEDYSMTSMGAPAGGSSDGGDGFTTGPVGGCG